MTGNYSDDIAPHVSLFTSIREWWITIVNVVLALLCGLGIIWVYLFVHHNAQHNGVAQRNLTTIETMATIDRQQILESLTHDLPVKADLFMVNATLLDSLVRGLRPSVVTHQPIAPEPALELALAGLESSADALLRFHLERPELPLEISARLAWLGDCKRLYGDMLSAGSTLRGALDSQTTRNDSYHSLILRILIALWCSFIVMGVWSIVRRERRRRTAEGKLRRRQDEYDSLMRVAPVGIFRADRDGRCTYLSERSAELLSLPRQDGVSVEWIDMIHPDDCARVRAAWQQAVKTGKNFRAEARLLKSDNSIQWILAEAVPETDSLGFLTGFVGSISDISDRRRAEQELRESEERFRRLSDAATEGILIHEAGIALDANEAYARMIGLPRNRIPGQNVMRWVDPNQHEDILQRIRTDDDRPYELSAVREDGTRFPAEIMGRSMPLHGRKVRVVAIRDLSDRKKAEMETAMFKAMTDVADYGSAICDLNGTFIYVNARYAAMHGFSPNELVGRHLGLCHDLTRIGDMNKVLQQFIAADRPGTREIWHRRKDGSVFPTLQTATVVHGADRRPLYVAGFVIDITDLKETERMLQQMAAVPENDPNLVLTISADGEVLYRNPTATEISFIQGNSLDRIWDLLPRDVDDIIVRAVESKCRVVDVEREADGGTWSWSFHPVPGQSVVHCYGRDVTDRNLRQRQLRQLYAAVTQSQSMICITDTAGVIEYVNRRFCEVTGYSPDEAIGRNASLLKSGRHEKNVYAAMWNTITAGSSWSGRLQNRRRNGELYWERKSISPVFSDDGAIINYLSVGEDITAELHTQQKLSEADKMSAVGMLAAGVAHEFKNYLGGIIGNASFALDELDHEGGLELARSTLRQIIETGDRANDVAMSLLSYSKAKADDFATEDLRQIVLRSLKLVEKEMKTQAIELITHFDEIPPVEVSASKIQQLLLNLLINARHAIGSDGVISVILLKFDAHVEIRVGDSGVGIPEENLGKIFDPFYSTKGVWGKDELVGTGMGLAICRNIAREHGGDLTVDSVPGMGTSFTLSLPLDRRQSAPPALTESRDRIRVLLFALDKEIYKTYVKPAAAANARLLWVDSIASVGPDLARTADLVVCDAKFTGKVELLRMVERCRAENVPYAMINCGVMEYQLVDLYEGSRANFKQCPDITRLLGCAAGPQPVVE